MLRKNSSDPLVGVLTEQLKALGYYSEPATNTFGAEVVKAVKAFQVQSTDSSGRPLVVDGIVGPVTEWALARAVAQTLHVAGTPAISLPMPLTGGSSIARAALRKALDEMSAGAGEVGGDNMGPWVRKYLNGIVAPPNDWCAGFVSWCFANSGQPMPFAYSVGARDVFSQLKGKGFLVNVSDANPPLPGDVIVWWRQAPTSWKGHIGIVYGYSGGVVRTIEGNHSEKVSSFSYTLAKIERLLGFCRVP